MEVKRLMALVPVAVLRMLNTGTLNCVVTGNKKAKLIDEQIIFTEVLESGKRESLHETTKKFIGQNFQL
jgi:hypothetical protein